MSDTDRPSDEALVPSPPPSTLPAPLTGPTLAQGAQFREVPNQPVPLQPVAAPAQAAQVNTAPQPQQAYGLPPGMVMPNITIVNNNTAAQTGAGVVVVGQKSLGLAIVLTFFFGPLGMLYSTVPGAIVTFIIGFISILLGGWAMVVILWPIELIWTYTGVKKHNARLYLRAA